MNTWLVPRQNLTTDQAHVVGLPPLANRLVLGFAGSGKTQVLIHRADHISKTFHIPAARYRVFVFTNIIKEYIRSGFEFLGLPDESVSTFDFWCVALYQKHLSSRLPRLPGGKFLDFPGIRREVLELVRTTKAFRNSLEFVLVDEGQDLCTTTYEILQIVARHVTVFADPQQKIFDDGADESFIKDKLKIEMLQVTLLGAYRNAIYVANLAAHFIEDPGKRAQYLAQVSAEQRIKEKPLCFLADSFDQEMDRLAEVIRQRQVLNERIGIIVPTNRLLHGLAEGLAERGVQVERAVAKEKGGKVSTSCNFSNLVPKIATFYQAKGLTFDSVMLPRLTDKAYYWTKRSQRMKILFVGIARATQWAYLSTVRGQEFVEMAVLREAAEHGHLTMQNASDFPKRGSGPSSGDNDYEPSVL